MTEMPSSIWTTLLGIREDSARVKDLVVRRYREPVYRFARREGLSHEDADDIAQEVFLRVCRREFLEGADRKNGKFRTLLLAVTKHVIAKLRERELADKRDRRRTVPLSDFEIPAQEPSDGEFDRLWVENLVVRAVDELGDAPMVRALRLQLAGKSYREIAADLGRSESDVTNYLHRAKERLRQEIERLIGEYSHGQDVQGEVAALLQFV